MFFLIIALLFGDPHIASLDGKTFILHGIGEYRLLEFDHRMESGEMSTFKLQVSYMIDQKVPLVKSSAKNSLQDVILRNHILCIYVCQSIGSIIFVYLS